MALHVLVGQAVPAYLAVAEANRAVTEATRTNYPEAMVRYMSVVGLVSMVQFLASLIFLVLSVLANRTAPSASRG
jgi:hypothetical protein